MIKEVEKFKALGEETRLRIMRIMIKAGTELCACEIIDILDKQQYTISKSLGTLVSAGFLSERREGRMMFYALLNSDFNSPLFDSIKQITCDSNAIFKNDFSRLAARIASRKDGKCIGGCAV
jgi:ArsR family transcriptional regulator, arsenate/arsenite/antimonite-responsive transcriptional repressor